MGASNSKSSTSTASKNTMADVIAHLEAHPIAADDTVGQATAAAAGPESSTDLAKSKEDNKSSIAAEVQPSTSQLQFFTRKGFAGLTQLNRAVRQTALQTECMRTLLKEHTIKIYLNNRSTLIYSDAGLWVCGNNFRGQLGLGHDDDHINTFTKVPLPKDIGDILSVHMLQWSMFIRTNTGLWAHGSNMSGCLGLGHENHQYNLTKVPLHKDMGRILSVQTERNSNSAFIHSTTGLWACGQNGTGQLGLGDEINRSSFSKVPLSSILKLYEVKAIEAALITFHEKVEYSSEIPTAIIVPKAALLQLIMDLNYFQLHTVLDYVKADLAKAMNQVAYDCLKKKGHEYEDKKADVNYLVKLKQIYLPKVSKKDIEKILHEYSEKLPRSGSSGIGRFFESLGAAAAGAMEPTSLSHPADSSVIGKLIKFKENHYAQVALLMEYMDDDSHRGELLWQVIEDNSGKDLFTQELSVTAKSRSRV